MNVSAARRHGDSARASDLCWKACPPAKRFRCSEGDQAKNRPGPHPRVNALYLSKTWFTLPLCTVVALRETLLMSKYDTPAFVIDLLHARSLSGCEFEAQKVFDHDVKPVADKYAQDVPGNRLQISGIAVIMKTQKYEETH
jgi:hypothetical protein